MWRLVPVHVVIRGEGFDAFGEFNGVFAVGVLLGLHGSEDYRVVLDEAFFVIVLAGLNALRQEVVADRVNNALCVCLFVEHPACGLVHGLCVGFAFEFVEHFSGFQNGGGIFEHRFHTCAVVIYPARHLAVGLSGLRGHKGCGGEGEREGELG